MAGDDALHRCDSRNSAWRGVLHSGYKSTMAQECRVACRLTSWRYRRMKTKRLRCNTNSNFHSLNYKYLSLKCFFHFECGALNRPFVSTYPMESLDVFIKETYSRTPFVVAPTFAWNVFVSVVREALLELFLQLSKVNVETRLCSRDLLNAEQAHE